MRLILVGPPGSGKGTQAKLLRDRQGLTHIATGDILREAIRLGTPAGKRAEPYMAAGKFAPDELVNDLIAERFDRADRPTKFLLDGYPRTGAQAAFLDQVLAKVQLPLSRVVVLVVEDEEIVKRISGRRICPRCQTPYHVTSNPPRQPGICDSCAEKLVQRADDQEATVRHRLEEFHANLNGLLGPYASRGLVREVAGMGDIEVIYQGIVKAAG